MTTSPILGPAESGSKAAEAGVKTDVSPSRRGNRARRPTVIPTGRKPVASAVRALAGPIIPGNLFQTALGAGDIRFPMLATFTAIWLIRLPLRYLLGVILGWGPPVIYVANTQDAAGRATANYLRFRTGRWCAAGV